MTDSKLVAFKALLEQSGSALARVSTRAAQLEALTVLVRQALPEPARHHLIAASERDNALILTADSAAWAARMRFHERDILTHLQSKQGHVSQKVVVKVRGPARG